jgi:hypothetical protein
MGINSVGGGQASDPPILRKKKLNLRKYGNIPNINTQNEN